MLARGDVPSARRLIHRINRFIAWYLLAVEREVDDGPARRLHRGDVTSRPVTIARLAAIRTDLGWFYEMLMVDQALLAATDRKARGDELTANDTHLIDKHQLDSDQRRWEPLRRYLVSTFRSVETSTASISPILYLAQSESGRTLGVERLGRLTFAVRAGDTKVVGEAMADMTDADLPHAARETATILRSVTPAERRDAAAGAVTVLHSLGDEANAEIVASAVAELVRADDPGVLAPSDFVTLLEHLPPEQRHGVIEQFATTPEDEDFAAADERMLAAAGYLRDHPAAELLADSIETHLGEIDKHAGWGDAAAWIEVASHLVRDQHAQLVDRHVLPAMYRLAKDSEVDWDDAARELVVLVEAANPDSLPLLADPVRTLQGAEGGLATLLLATFVAGYPVADVKDALRLAEALQAEPSALQAPRSLQILATSATTWKDAKFKSDDPEAEPEYCATQIGANLATAALAGGSDVFVALAQSAEDFAGAPRAIRVVAEHLVAHGKAAPEGQRLEEPLVQSLTAVLAADLGVDPAAATPLNDLLAAYGEDGELTPRLESLLDVVPVLADSTDAGAATLESWRTAVQNQGFAMPRSRSVEAFRRLAEHDPMRAAEAVDPALQPLQNRLEAGNAEAPGELLSLIASLPWGDANLATAVALVEGRIDEAGGASTYLGLAQRAARAGVAIPATMSSRLADHLAEESAQQLPHAEALVGALNPADRASLLSRSVAASETARRIVTGLGDSEVVAVLVDAARNGRLASAAPHIQASEEAIAATLDQLANSQTQPEPDGIVALAEQDPDVVAPKLIALADSDDVPTSLTALRMLSALDTPGGDLRRTFDTVLAHRAADWSLEAVRLAVEIRGEAQVEGELKDAVDGMVNDVGDGREKAPAIRLQRGLWSGLRRS